MTKGQWKRIGILAIIVLFTLFVILNMRERAAISFIIGKAEMPLFIALAISFGLGFLVALLIVRNNIRKHLREPKNMSN